MPHTGEVRVVYSKAYIDFCRLMRLEMPGDVERKGKLIATAWPGYVYVKWDDDETPVKLGKWQVQEVK